MDRLHVYSFSWDEEKIVPYFLRHYTKIADRITVFDNESGDRTRELLTADPKVTVETVGSSGVHDELSHLTPLRNSVWRRSIGKAQWVMVVDMDEFVSHPNLDQFFASLVRDNYSWVRAFGWEMVSEEFPDADADLSVTHRRGVAQPAYSKPCLFDPNRILETNFTPGAHSARFVGEGRYLHAARLSLCHYKRLSFDYYWNRVKKLKARSKPEELRRGMHIHNHEPHDMKRKEFDLMLANSIDVLI